MFKRTLTAPNRSTAKPVHASPSNGTLKHGAAKRTCFTHKTDGVTYLIRFIDKKGWVADMIHPVLGALSVVNPTKSRPFSHRKSAHSCAKYWIRSKGNVGRFGQRKPAPERALSQPEFHTGDRHFPQ